MQSSSFRFARSACTTFLISTSFLSIAEGSSSRPSCCFNYLYPLHNSSQRTGTDSALESRFTDPCTRQEIRSSSTRTRTNPQVKSGSTTTSSSALTMNLDPTKPSSNALDPRTTSTSTQDNNNINVITTENEHDDSVEKSDEQIHTHYIFLIHGWLGNSSEMSYIETSINQAAVVAAKNGNPNARIVTHCAKSNDKRTTDGISHGGTRLADEILEFITNDAKKHFSEEPGEREREHEHHVSISFVGNSLGGLYGRYALSKLPTQLCLYFESDDDDEGNKSSPKSQSSIILHREIFATTATPHLGCASHTFVSIPRVLEQVIGRTLKDTGKDLFRIDSDDLIYQMCTDYELYLKPLSLFRKRIAYVNAFRTDFQVPTGTAAFLSRHSTYPHSIQCVDEESDHPYPPFIVAVANTDVNHDILREENPVQGKKHAMSVKLDASGWEKVFVDVRDYIPTPGFALPSFMKKNSRSRWNQFITSKGVKGVGDGDGDDEKLKLVQVQSRELEKLMKGSDRFEIPVGHQVMVANSKSEAYSSFTKGGRPVMDHMAQQMVKILLQ